MVFPPPTASGCSSGFIGWTRATPRRWAAPGLGLSIVKHAAAYHGAAVELESDEGAGTTITVIFPKPDAKARP